MSAWVFNPFLISLTFSFPSVNNNLTSPWPPWNPSPASFTELLGHYCSAYSSVKPQAREIIISCCKMTFLLHDEASLLTIVLKAHISNAKVFEKLKMVNSLFFDSLMGLLPEVPPCCAGQSCSLVGCSSFLSFVVYLFVVFNPSVSGGGGESGAVCPSFDSDCIWHVSDYDWVAVKLRGAPLPHQYTLTLGILLAYLFIHAPLLTKQGKHMPVSAAICLLPLAGQPLLTNLCSYCQFVLCDERAPLLDCSPHTCLCIWLLLFLIEIFL